MCSNSCDCEDNNVKKNLNYGELKEKKSPVCRRCGQSPPFIVLDRVHIECKICFLESCNKKIRSTIGKSKLVKLNDKVLVAFSGGSSGTALLYMIKNSFECTVGRQQTFRPSILHIDTNCRPYRGDLTDGKDRRHGALKNFLSETSRRYQEWDLYYTTIEQCVNLDNGLPVSWARYNQCSKKIEDLIVDANIECLETKMKDLDSTQKQQYIQEQIPKLLSQVATCLNYLCKEEDKIKFIFVGSTSTKLATDFLVNVILGLGSTSNPTVSVCDRRFDVPLFRPLRNFSKKEVAFYLRARDLNHHLDTNLATLVEGKSSIQKLTEGFLTKLYIDYPATYSTLLKTGSKLN